MLAIIWKPDFCQTCSSCKMLKDHSYFHFRAFSDKTNDMIFLKIPKTLFSYQFWLFLVFFSQRAFFSKSPLHTSPRSPSSKQSFGIKQKIWFQENCQTDERWRVKRTGGLKDGKTLIHRTLLATTKGPI